MNNKDRASRLFEQLYDPENLHINLSVKRGKNIEAINKLVEEYEASKLELHNSIIKELHDIEKINKVEKVTRNEYNGRTVIVKANVAISESEKEALRREARNKYDKSLRKLENDYKTNLRNVILKQAKTMLILKNNEEIYNFYCGILANPLEGKLAKLESDIYREFFMTHPGIENIIISYSEYLENKKMEEAKKAEEERKQKALEEAKKAEEERNQKALEEAKKAEEERKQKALEEAKKAEEERKQKALEEAKKAEEERKQKALEEAKKAEEERKQKALEEAKKAEEEAKKAKKNNDDDDQLDPHKGGKVEELSNDEIEKNIKDLLKKALLSLKSSDFVAVKKAINDVKDEALKEKLDNMFKAVLNKANEIIDNKDSAMKLVEKAKLEQTPSAIEAAKEAINKIDREDIRELLLKELNGIKVKDNTESEKSNDKFFMLFNKLSEEISNGYDVSSDEVKLLAKEFQNLDSFKASEYQNKVEEIIKYSNFQAQDTKKSTFSDEDVVLHSKKQMVYEFFGAIPALIKNSKLLKQRRAKKYEDLKDFYAEEYDNLEQTVDSDKVEYVEEKMQDNHKKLLDSIYDSDIVNNLKLFKTRNFISKLKPKLYHDEISDKENIKLGKKQKTFGLKLGYGLYKNINDETVENSSQRIINILNQYCELLSITPRLSEDYNIIISKLNEYLSHKKIKRSVYLAYFDQFKMIRDYRLNKNDDAELCNINSIYEYDFNDIEPIKKYYDSDEYEKSNYKLPYIK